MKQYLIRSVKYLVAFSVLYVGLLWVMHYFDEASQLISFKQRFTMMFDNGWDGWSMVVGIILLGTTYPYFGFVERSFEGNIVTDREQIDRAAELAGLSLVAESDTELIYRTVGLRRLVMLFEDEVKVRQVGNRVEVEGLRRLAARMAFDADRYITNKRRVE